MGAKSVKSIFQLSVYYFCRLLFFLAYKIIWRLKVKGAQHVPKHGAVIIAGNHKSYADPPLIGVCISRVGHFLAKRSLFEFLPFGIVLKLWNAHPTSRSGGAEAIKTAVQLLAEGDAVILFPEGKRIHGDDLGEPRSGVGMLALSTKTPVIPAFVHNTDKLLKFKKLSVVFGAPIHPEDSQTYLELTEKIMAAIRHLKDTHFPKTP